MELLLTWFGSGFAFAVGVFVGASLMTFASNPKRAIREIREMDEKILAYWSEKSRFQVEMLALTAQKVEQLSKMAEALEVKA